LLLVTGSCNNRVYDVIARFDPDKPAVGLDDTYRKYMRYVYRGSDSRGHRVLKTVSEKTLTDTVLLEVEYLLVSDTHRNVIYITTIPDKYQKWYTRNLLPHPSWINAYDFNTFHFGKITGEGEYTFSLPGGSISRVWNVEIAVDEIKIDRIDQKVDGYRQEAIFVSDAIGFPIFFDARENSNVVFSSYKDRLLPCDFLNRKIYIKEERRGFRIYMEFTCDPTAKERRKQKRIEPYSYVISFGKKRVRYSPLPLLTD